jgi:hypothetical protein
MKTRLALLIPTLLAFALLAAVPVDAQVARPRAPVPDASTEGYRYAYESGYREGLELGRRDGRSGRPFDYGRHREYVRADRGYDRRLDREAYRQSFRQGFVVGYREGYDRSGYGWNQPRSPYPAHPSRPGASARYPGRHVSQAFHNGFEDGYRKGLDAAHGRDRYDPRRERWYRQGDRGYDRRHGSKDRYKAEYRDGFTAGYDQGYREARDRSYRAGGPVWGRWP